ncbi:MAG TPA: ROK family protein, partial [Verrucomicrobiae bacterium]|nr:ROK family protein [Verrucomicrobiae bacterium]
MPEAASKSDAVVGVDLGGTKIFAGVFNGALECIGTSRISTKAQRGPDAVIDRIERCIRDAIDEADLTLKQVAAVGIGAPGAVNSKEGMVIFAPNLDGWKEIPLRKALEKRLEIPVRVENDANIAV